MMRVYHLFSKDGEVTGIQLHTETMSQTIAQAAAVEIAGRVGTSIPILTLEDDVLMQVIWGTK